MNVLLHHPTIFAIGGYWLFSALVGGMPEPKPTSSSGYLWAYNSLHILAGNLTAAVAAKYPQSVTVAAPAVPGTTTTVTTGAIKEQP